MSSSCSSRVSGELSRRTGRRSVTGSAGSIGSEIVRQLAAEGASVVGADFAGDADVRFDVSDAAAVQYAIDAVVREHGRIDVLVNAAGIFGDMTRTDRIDPDVWDRYLRVNLSGPFYVIRAVLPHMVERRWGRIVNLSSISSTEGGYRQAHYTAAKAGLIGLTRSIAAGVRHRRDHVQRSAPGPDRHRQARRSAGRRPGFGARVDPGSPDGYAGRHRRRGPVPGIARCGVREWDFHARRRRCHAPAVPLRPPHAVRPTDVTREPEGRLP